jgi:hypothetical protein
MKELIERLEKATGPDRGIDCLITAALFDPLVMTNPGNHKGEGVERKPLSAVIADGFPVSADLASIVGSPAYTASIDAALSLLEDGWEYSISTLYGLADVELPLNDTTVNPIHVRRLDGNVTLALVEAALRAREAMKPDQFATPVDPTLPQPPIGAARRGGS